MPTTTATVPSAPSFSFKAPFPAESSSQASAMADPSSSSSLKQRRVSLALPSTPRVVQPWSFRDDTTIDSHSQPQSQSSSSSSLSCEKRGKMRKISTSMGSAAADDNGTSAQPVPDKKPRKKWTPEETKMLVDGCQRHGVGNWKTILSDPDLRFDNRSPVDLKDRFRTYFPDAYKQHYPNARTHLSSKVRSMLPDGTPLFEKTRSKKRRPFTEEEDRALKAGYEKHGTVWAAIVKDPIFQGQNRRSTDLRDRFRNAFPDLYQAAGYKPRNSARKKQLQQQESHREQQQSTTGNTSSLLPKVSVRAATDDQLVMSSTGPVRSRRRSHTTHGLFRGGTKSVPQSAVCSEDDDSSGGEDESEPISRQPPTPVLVDNVSTGKITRDKKKRHSMLSPFETAIVDDNDEMEMVTIDQLTEPIFLPPPQSWPSPSIDTLVNSSHSWSASTASPASSAHLSPDLMMFSAQSSPFHRNVDEGLAVEAATRTSSSGTSSSSTSNNMIGNSAWGMQDWFSSNPRLDSTGGTGSTSGTPSLEGHNTGLFLGSPLPFLHNHYHLSQGVVDRYDLFPASMSSAGLGFGGSLSGGASPGLSTGAIGGGSFWSHHDYASEISEFGTDTHSAFSDDVIPAGGFRGFTHHSNYAGDLIFGARTHQPPLHHWYSPTGLALDPGSNTTANAGNGANPSSSSSRQSTGASSLGLSDMSVQATQAGGIHPMQLHTPSLIGIDEIELAGITLDDRPDTPAPQPPTPASQTPLSKNPNNDNSAANDSFEVDMEGISEEVLPRSQRQVQSKASQSVPLLAKKDEMQDRLDLDDLVDLSVHDNDDDDELRHHRAGAQRWGGIDHKAENTIHRFDREHSVDVDLDVDLEDHATPPATPLIPSAALGRDTRRASHHFSSAGSGRAAGGSGQHGRSISVPPSEARSPAFVNTPGPSAHHQYHEYNPFVLSSPRPLRSATLPFNTPQPHIQPHLHNSTQAGTISSKPATVLTPTANNNTTISPHLLFSPSSSSTIALGSGPPGRITAPHGMMSSFSGSTSHSDVPYDLPFLDLHYHGSATGSYAPSGGGLGGTVSAAGMLFDESPTDLSTTLLSSPPTPSSSSVRHALDLAQSQGAAGVRYQGNPSLDIPHYTTTNARRERVGRGPLHAVDGTATTTTSSVKHHHQRGQSVASVCPQDLVIRRESNRVDNKRKRASWDGFDGVYG